MFNVVCSARKTFPEPPLPMHSIKMHLPTRWPMSGRDLRGAGSDTSDEFDRSLAVAIETDTSRGWRVTGPLARLGGFSTRGGAVGTSRLGGFGWAAGVANSAMLGITAVMSGVVRTMALAGLRGGGVARSVDVCEWLVGRLLWAGKASTIPDLGGNPRLVTEYGTTWVRAGTAGPLFLPSKPSFICWTSVSKVRDCSSSVRVMIFPFGISTVPRIGCKMFSGARSPNSSRRSSTFSMYMPFGNSSTTPSPCTWVWHASRLLASEPSTSDSVRRSFAPIGDN